LTVELSCQGFCVVSNTAHDTISSDSKEELLYFETPYSLLDSLSPGYRQAFGDSLAQKLRKLSSEQQQQQQQQQQS
jgi:hypothetical protein